MKGMLRAAVLMLLASALVAPLSAASFKITLKDGGTFESLYKPIDAPWDAQKLLFEDEVGNRIALDKSDVTSVESSVEESGYGHVIDSTTVALGWAPNDLPQEGTPEAAQMAADQAAQQAASSTAGQSSEPIYNVEDIPPTMQIIPSMTPEGQPYIVPAPTRPPANTDESSPPQ